MIKNILTSIEYEINEDYIQNFGKWDKFIENTNDILDYYKLSIYKAGKTNINQKINNSIKNIEQTKYDNDFLLAYNFTNFLN